MFLEHIFYFKGNCKFRVQALSLAHTGDAREPRFESSLLACLVWLYSVTGASCLIAGITLCLQNGKQNPELVKDSPKPGSLKPLSTSLPSVRISMQLLSFTFRVKLNRETGLESADSRRVGPSCFQFCNQLHLIVDNIITRHQSGRKHPNLA